MSEERGHAFGKEQSGVYGRFGDGGKEREK